MDPTVSAVILDLQGGELIQLHKIANDPYRSRDENIKLAYRELLRLAVGMKKTILAMDDTPR